MFKRIGVALAAVTVVIALAGCGASAPEKPEQVDSSALVASTQPSESVALTPDEKPVVEVAPPGDELFITEVRARLTGMTETSDDALIAAGHQACELYSQGQPKQDMRFIDGEVSDKFGTYPNSIVIALWAAEAYCPEFA